jgi:hypothetical protein
MTRKILGKLLEEATEVRGERSEDRFGRKFLGCVEYKIDITKKGIRQFLERRQFWRRRDIRIDRRRNL